MKKFTYFLAIAIIVLSAFKDSGQRSFQKVLTNDHYNYISINNILMFIANDGDGSHDPATDGNGFYWQESSAIFEDGLLWGGMIKTVSPDTQNIRVNGNTHRQGLQAGKILANGQADDPANPKYRVYKVRRDWQELPFGSERDNYQKDYEEWPAADGAPWLDINDDNIYTPYVDQPDFVGDELLWYVANDLDTIRSLFIYSSLPLGLEQQCTVWGFNHAGELGNMVFKKYRVINKGQYDIDSMYFTYWSDPDLGGPVDDYAGVDTSHQMAYAYNSDDEDTNYQFPVPAAGYVLLQNAIVKSDLSDSAFFNNGWHGGYINTSLSSFMAFTCGPPFRDPPYGEYAGTLEFYNLMQGKDHTGNVIIDPQTGQPVTTQLAGDPVNGTGWYEGAGWPDHPNCGDRRMIISQGPFHMARGDTQEVVYAIVIGRGKDHIDSISKIRRLASIARTAFYNNFEYPVMAEPDLKISALDQQVVLQWNDQVETFNTTDPYIDQIESHDATYTFEGYRVWQYRDMNGSDPRLRAIFDLNNGIKEIFEYQTVNGILGLTPLFISPDEGLRRSFTITKDAYTEEALKNGSACYFSVTAYAYNLESAKRVLESKPVIMEVIPQKQNINTTFSNNYEDLIFGEQVVGDGHGQILAQIINPDLIKTSTYRVVINRNEKDTQSWTFISTDISDTLARNETDFSLDTIAARNYDGFKLMVQNQGRDSLEHIYGKEFGVKSVIQVADATGELDQPRDVVYGTSSNSQWHVTTYGPEEVRQNINAPTSDVIGYDNYEIRFTSEEEGSEYFIYGYTGSYRGPVTNDPKAINKVPFQIWNVGRDLNSTADDIRLKIKIRDNFLQPGEEDKYVADSLWNRAPNGNWEAIYGFIEQDSSYHDNQPQYSGRGYTSHFFIHNFVISGELPAHGTVIRIIPWRPLSEGDVFELSTIGPDTMDYNKARQNLDKITVFPNPCFGSEYRNNQPGQGFVRFGNLPPKATIRIYSIAGQLVSKFEKDDPSPWADWNLRTVDNKKAPSGIYIAHIQMPKIGKKILKIALVQQK